MGKIDITELFLIVGLPLCLVGISAWGFVNYSKTKKAGWAVVGAICGALFLIMLVAAVLLVNQEPWRREY